MKKLFLMSAACALSALEVSAQIASHKDAGTSLDTKKASTIQATTGLIFTGYALPTEKDPVVKPNAKPTVGGSRWYSYVDYISFLTSSAAVSDSVNSPYLWHKSDAKAIYSAVGGGVVADTIELSSFGITFDPAFRSSTTSTLLEGFNEPAIYDANSIVVTRARNYTIDSVMVWSAYGRNPSRTTAVDTLRVAVVYGNGTGASDLPAYFWSTTSGGFPKDAYGYDTVRFGGMKYDKSRNILKGATRVIKDIYLTSADTSLSSFKGYGVPIGLNVPAGNFVGISATFISGDSYTPYVDTIFYGSAKPSAPFNRGMMRPMFVAEPPSAGTKSGTSYQRYYPGYYNAGFVKFKPQIVDSWDTLYVPTLAYVAAFDLEFPNIDVKVSCSSCNTIKEVSVLEQTIFEEVNAFPNPANTELNIPVVVKEKANVTVNVSNMIGQVVATQNLGTLNAGQKATATFNTSSLPAGVYMYTVEGSGQHYTNRFTVAH